MTTSAGERGTTSATEPHSGCRDALVNEARHIRTRHTCRKDRSKEERGAEQLEITFVREIAWLVIAERITCRLGDP